MDIFSKHDPSASAFLPYKENILFELNMKSAPVRLGRVPGDRDKFYISFAFQGSAREINGFSEKFFATLSKEESFCETIFRN